MEKDDMLVFVYGTLKRGEPNHHWMLGKDSGIAVFLGEGTTKTKYPLVIASKFNIPFLLNVPSQGEKIKGEIYAINKQKLLHLDVLEDYPKLYTRREENVTIATSSLSPEGATKLQAKTEVPCLVYFLIKHKPEMMELPRLTCYSSAGAHGKPYNSGDDELSDPDDI